MDRLILNVFFWCVGLICMKDAHVTTVHASACLHRRLDNNNQMMCLS